MKLEDKDRPVTMAGESGGASLLYNDNVISVPVESAQAGTIRKDVVQLGKTTLIYGAGNLLNRFIGFLLLPLLTAYLTPADYGIAAILVWLTNLLTPFFSLGLGSSITVDYFDGNNQAQKETVVWTSFFILAISCLVLVVPAVSMSGIISRLLFQTDRYHYVVALSLLTTGLYLLTIPFPLYLQFEERARLYLILTTLTTLVSIGLTLLFVIVLKKGIRGMIEANFISQIINTTVFLALGIIKVRYRHDFRIAKSLLRVGVPLIPCFAYWFVIQNGNRYILQWFYNLSVLGIYSIGYNIGMGMMLFVVAFQSAWTPYFMKFNERHDEARILFGRIMTYYVLGFGALSLVFYITAKPVVMLMTQPLFHEAYTVIGPTASASFFAGICYILLPAMYFAKEIHLLGPIQISAAIVTVIANVLLIPQYQILGAALANMLGMFSMIVASYVWNKRRKDTYLQVQYEWDRMLKFFFVYLAFMTVELWKRDLSVSREVWFSMISALALSAVMYLFLEKYERRALWQFLRNLQPGKQSGVSS